MVIFLPLLGAIVIACLKRPKEAADTHGHGEESDSSPDRAVTVIRWTALSFAALTFVISLVLLARFDRSANGFQFRQGPAAWIEQFKIYYDIGIDGTSLLLVLLTTFTSLLAVGFSFNIKHRIKEFMV